MPFWPLLTLTSWPNNLGKSCKQFLLGSSTNRLNLKSGKNQNLWWPFDLCWPWPLDPTTSEKVANSFSVAHLPIAQIWNLKIVTFWPLLTLTSWPYDLGKSCKQFLRGSATNRTNLKPVKRIWNFRSPLDLCWPVPIWPQRLENMDFIRLHGSSTNRTNLKSVKWIWILWPFDLCWPWPLDPTTSEKVANSFSEVHLPIVWIWNP